MAPASLLTNIKWSFIGNVTYNFCQWAVLVVLAKSTSPDELGQFALAVAIAGPIFTFSNLQLRTILVADINDSNSFSQYLGLRIVSSSLALIVVLSIAVFSTDNTYSLLVIFIFSAAKYFDSLSDLTYGLMQKHEIMNQVSKSLIIRGISSLFLIFLFVYLTHSVLVAVICYLFAWAIVFVYFDKRKALTLLREKHDAFCMKPDFNVKIIRTLFLFSLPLAIVVFLNAVSTNVPRYTISSALGDAELGIFAAIASFMVVGSTIIGAVSQSALPRLARYYVNDRPKYIKFLLSISAMGLLVGISGVFVAWLVGEPVLRIVFTAEYARHAELLVWVMIAAIPLYLASIAGVGIAAVRRYRAQALVTAASTTIVLLTAVLLVPEKGLMGGAMALGYGFTFKWIGQLAIVYWMSRSPATLTFSEKV